MIKLDEDSLICDFAETYGIHDFRSLPLRTAATLAAGLGKGSRIKLKMSGLKYPIETILLASAVDRLSYLVWFKTKDAAKGRRQPKMFMDILLSEPKKKEEKAFLTADDFEKRRKEILEGIRDGDTNS